MGIVSLDIRLSDVAEEVWALQHPAYQVEAALIGVADLPPLRDTIESLQTCGETFGGYRCESGELSGAISYEREREGCYTLCRLMVHPDYLRQGIGSLLIEHLLFELPKPSLCSVTAEIRNMPAIALYERYGFERKDTYQPVSRITMLRLERRIG
jgi:GNAT superfamily N-acetyltransferase